MTSSQRTSAAKEIVEIFGVANGKRLQFKRQKWTTDNKF